MIEEPKWEKSLDEGGAKGIRGRSYLGSGKLF